MQDRFDPQQSFRTILAKSLLVPRLTISNEFKRSCHDIYETGCTARPFAQARPGSTLFDERNLEVSPFCGCSRSFLYLVHGLQPGNRFFSARHNERSEEHTS